MPPPRDSSSSASSSSSSSSTEKMTPRPNPTPTTTSKLSRRLKIKYCPLEHIRHHEELKYYRRGGYHPILVGDKLGESERFTVARKLGYGTFGTVWMCWDRESKRLRAVKVMQADTSGDGLKQEVGLLAELSKSGDHEVSVEEAYRNHLAVPLEHFWHEGPNGKHLCVVMPVLGPKVTKAKALGDVDFLRDVCSQITRGLAFLHGRGMAHGDLHPGNVLLQTNLGDLGEDDIASITRQHDHEALYAEGHNGPGPYAPKHIYPSLDWAEVDPKHIKKEVAIIDFGTCFKAWDPPRHHTTHISLRPPEQFFTARPSQAADLWALGCTLMHVLGSGSPFRDSPEVRTWSPVPRWEEALGPLPEPYRAKWIASKGLARKRKFDEIEGSEPVSVTAEKLAARKKRRLEECGTEDVICAFLARPSRIRVPAGKEQQEQPKRPEASEASNSNSNSDSASASRTDGSSDGNIEPPETEQWSLPSEELDSATSLVRSLFKYKPSDRTTARALLAHPFLARRTPQPPPPPGPPPPPAEAQNHSPERTSPAASAAGTP